MTLKIQEVKGKRRVSQADFSSIAEGIVEQFESRKNNKKRKNLELEWKDIDRQLEMVPDLKFKLDKLGRPIPERAWEPEVELPLQAQTLEITMSDARRMMFPDSGPWFAANGKMTDEYLERVQQTVIPIPGENDPPSLINQDNVNKVIEGALTNFHNQYDFGANVDLITAEAVKYGLGVGRGRPAKKSVFMDTARGTVKKEQEIPVLFPRSIKNTYPDDTEAISMNEGYIVGPATIYAQKRKFTDIALAANRGNTDPENPNGGWMPKNLKDFKTPNDDFVDEIEFEGDLIVKRKTTRALFVPNVIVTVVRSHSDATNDRRVIRIRFRKQSYSTYVFFPYHKEHVDSPYAASPLMKGRPIQIAAVTALRQLLSSGELSNFPPVSYDGNDQYFAAEGGPRIEPRVLWKTIGQIGVHNDIGRPGPLLQMYLALLQQYSDVTGVNAPRLGAQTVSHTTAFAKEAELSRGTIRTVDFVRGSLKGPLTQWLYMAYDMSKDLINGQEIFIEAYKGFVKLNKGALPDDAVFEVFGSGGPAEEQAKKAQRFSALQQAIQIDQFRVDRGEQPKLDLDNVIDQILREGGWADVEAFTRVEGVPQGAGGPPALEAITGGVVPPNAPALQNLTG